MWENRKEAFFRYCKSVGISYVWGVWIDSTVYIADDVPDYMTGKFFVFKQSPQLRECRAYGNW